jgi:hypothetical protein
MTRATPASETINAKPLAAFANGGGRKRKGRERDYGARKEGRNTRAETPLALFGSPQLLQGEDGATYDELLSRFRAAINPVDIIDEMFVADVVALEWEVLRWRRLKSSFMQMRGHKELKNFLLGHLPYDHWREYVVRDLLEILQEEYEDRSEAQRVARECADYNPDAVRMVKMILDNCELDLTELTIDAHTRKVEELAQDYAQRKPDAIKLIDELLGGAGSSIDALMITAISEVMDKIDQINRLATNAESRRNATLREIDRRRVPLGQALRQQVREVEGEYEVIETTPAVTSVA